jgi:hypothetical protein
MRHGLRLQDLLVELAKLKEVGDEDPAALALQAALSLELHELLVSSAVLSKGIATLAFNLFSLAHRCGPPGGLGRPQSFPY